MTGASRQPAASWTGRRAGAVAVEVGSQIGPSGSALLEEVVRIIDIYSENVKVEPLEVISTNELGLVLTSETANLGVSARPGAPFTSGASMRSA